MGNFGSPFYEIIMKEPTHFELCQMIAKKDTVWFWDYINEVLIDNDKIRVVQSHLHRSFSLSYNTQMGHYVGVFKPKGNERFYGTPVMYFLEKDHILFNDCGSTEDEFINERFEIGDKGTEFNFNLMNSEIGITFPELKVLLEFAQRIKCSFFITTVNK